MRAPVAVVTGAVMVYRASVPVIGSWLIDCTRSRRRLAVKPISRSAGRFGQSFPDREVGGVVDRRLGAQRSPLSCGAA